MRIRSAALGTTALLVLLTAGAAQSLTGSNTVFSDDIVNGQVTSADIANGTITGTDIKDNYVTSADIQNNGLTGTDINEATLGKVPSAAKADSVGGMTVTPIKLTSQGEDQAVFSEGQNYTKVWCDTGTGDPRAEVMRQGTDALLMQDWSDNGGTFRSEGPVLLGQNSGRQPGGSEIHEIVTNVRSDGTTVADFTGFWDGSACQFRGTVTRY